MRTVADQIVTEIDRKQVLHDIGYNTGSRIPNRIIELVLKCLEDAKHLINPSYSYVIRDVDFVHGSNIFIENAVILQSKVIARLLERCEQVAIFVSTIGNQLEETLAHLAEKGQVLHARVLDAIGSNAAERVAEFVQDLLQHTAEARGLCIGRRFSPGYCDWGINQQKIVFRAMNGSTTGVSLTDGCLMVPRKSISGIIGIGTDESGVEDYNPCITCNKADCLGRR